MSNVTGLWAITNLYAGEIKFTNSENEIFNRSIPTLTTFALGEERGGAYIPWCDSKQQFLQKHMKIESANLIYYVWQSGPNIRYSHDEWSADALHIPGNSKIAQSVSWVLDASGKLTQTSYSYL